MSSILIMLLEAVQAFASRHSFCKSFLFFSLLTLVNQSYVPFSATGQSSAAASGPGSSVAVAAVTVPVADTASSASTAPAAAAAPAKGAAFSSRIDAPPWPALV